MRSGVRDKSLGNISLYLADFGNFSVYSGSEMMVIQDLKSRK
jgi:hypothetical protein